MFFSALSSTAGYLLSGLRQPSHPACNFSGIFPDPFYLLPARGLPAHATLVTCALIVLQNLHMEVHKKILFKCVSWIYSCEDAKRLIWRFLLSDVPSTVRTGVQHYYQEFERKWFVHVVLDTVVFKMACWINNVKEVIITLVFRV